MEFSISIWNMVSYDLLLFMLKIETFTGGTNSMPFLVFRRNHLRSTSGIICGSGSSAVRFEDHFRSGIICGAVQDLRETGPWLRRCAHYWRSSRDENYLSRKFYPERVNIYTSERRMGEQMEAFCASSHSPLTKFIRHENGTCSHAFPILTQMVACLLPLISVGILAVERKLRVMKIEPREEK